MERTLDQVEFQAENISDLGELLESGVRPAVLKAGQPAQRDSSQFRHITLTQAEQFPSITDFLSNFLEGHSTIRRIIVRLTVSPEPGIPCNLRKAHLDALLRKSYRHAPKKQAQYAL
jgi:hypothetical protein